MYHHSPFISIFLKLRTLDAFPPSWNHDAADNLAWDSYAHSVSQHATIVVSSRS